MLFLSARGTTWIQCYLLKKKKKKKKKRKTGVGSYFALTPAFDASLADYAASKAAVKVFHEALETELKYVYKTPNVKTTLVCCGKIETGMFQGVRENMPFFTPTLEPIEVVRQIIASMELRRGRNQIMMPLYANFVPFVSITPVWFQDLARRISGEIGRAHV